MARERGEGVASTKLTNKPGLDCIFVSSSLQKKRSQVGMLGKTQVTHAVCPGRGTIYFPEESKRKATDRTQLTAGTTSMIDAFDDPSS